MKKRYLAMLLAIATVFVQTVGTGQVVWAAQIAEEELQEGDVVQEKERETEETEEVEEKKLEAEEPITEGKESQVGEEQKDGGVQPAAGEEKEALSEKEATPRVLSEDKQKATEVTILPEAGKELRGGNNWTWLFEGETQTFHVDVDDSSTVQWAIGRYTENGSEFFTEGAAGNPVTWTISEKSISITGKSESSQLFISASCGDVQHQIQVDIRKRKMEPIIWPGQEEKIERLPSECLFSKTDVGGYCYVENEDYPNGEELPLKTQSIKSEDEHIASIGEEGIDWVFKFKNIGQTNIIITCCLQDDETQIFEKKIPVKVKETIYNMNIVTDTGVDKMLFDDTLDLTANIEMCNWSEDESVVAGPPFPDDFRIVWDYEVYSDGTDGEDIARKVKLVPDTKNPANCQITAGEVDHYYEVAVRAKAYKDNEEVASGSIELSVNDFYELLEPVSINTSILPGETVEIPGLGVYHYQRGKEKELRKDVLLSFEYETGIFEITKGGQTISSGNETRVEAGDFTVKRLQAGGASLRVDSWVQKEDGQWDYVETREWWFDQCFYDGVCFEKDFYEMYASDIPEENEIIDMKLNTESIKTEHTIEWTVGLMDEEGDFEQVIDASNYTASENVLNLDANRLKKALKAMGDESEYLHISVCAVVKIGGVEATRAYSGATIKTPKYELEGVWDRTEILDARLYYDKKTSCYVVNKKYPGGNDIPVTLSDVVIEQEEKVWEKSEEDSEIILKAVGCGEAVVTFKTQSEELGDKDFTVNMSVTDDMYQLIINDGSDFVPLLPGKSHKLNIEVVHRYYDSKSGGIKEEPVKDPSSYVTYHDFNTDFISVKDGTITAKPLPEEPVYIDVRVHLSVPRDGRDNFECDQQITVYVTNRYYQAVVEKMYVEPGETVSLVPVKLLRFDTEHENGIEEKGFRYELSDAWSVTLNKEKTGFTVDNDLEEGEILSVGITVEKSVDDEEITEYVWMEIEVCKHNFVVKSTKQDNCAAEGVKTLECTKCHTVKTEVIPKTNHTFSEWKTTREATVFAEGVQSRTCGRCHASETRTISKLKAFIKLNAKTVPLKVKQSTTAIKVTMEKGDSIASWKSSNPKVASVNSKGKITGKKVGTAKITITLKSGVKATIKVKVQKKDVATSKLSVTGKASKIGKKLTLKKGKSAALAVTVTPVTSKQKVTYKSSNKKVATVTSKGKITAKKPGKAKITVKSGKKKVVITVTVKK